MSVVSGPTALPTTIRRPLGVAAALAALLVTWQALVYAGTTGGEWVAPRSGPSGLWLPIAQVVDFVAEPVGAPIVLGALAVLCLALRQRRSAVLLVVAAGVTVAATTLLKPLVARTIHGDNLSFPSGHTAFATTLALVMAMVAVQRSRLRRAAATAIVLGTGLLAAALMGWAQVVLSAHYASDALGGFGTALVVVPVTAYLIDRFAEQRHA
ncbi:phosphatase PAP2 family protein [Saccharomonospora sp. NPDC046836]|uniref:phosphatase PAP2 family protein n=1 Tax=Saccharomonospora sp. NPDC046836 TaxID=3156921 RepID=UPI0033E4A16F